MKLRVAKTTWERVLVVIARMVVAGVFLRAALPKLVDPVAFVGAIENFRVVSGTLASASALIVPILELVVALALVTGIHARGAALVAATMLATFSVAIAQAIHRGIDLSCGCFGAASTTRATYENVAFDLGLLAIGLVVVFYDDVPWRSFLGSSGVGPTGPTGGGPMGSGRAGSGWAAGSHSPAEGAPARASTPAGHTGTAP